MLFNATSPQLTPQIVYFADQLDDLEWLFKESIWKARGIARVPVAAIPQTTGQSNRLSNHTSVRERK